jgi:TolA-binding protein
LRARSGIERWSQASRPRVSGRLRGTSGWPPIPSNAIIDPPTPTSTLEPSTRAPSSHVRPVPSRSDADRKAHSTPLGAACVASRSTALLTVALALVGATFARAQAPRPDQVFRIDPRTGQIVTVSGRVELHGLERVEIVRKDEQKSRFDSAEVVEVVFGDVPPSYSDAQRYIERGDYENAVARFRVAAGDATARPVVQGRARLAAAEALMAWGATEPTRFREAADEAQTFLTSFAADRNVPVARALLGRAQLLAGDPAASAATLKSLFEAGQAGTVGYSKALTLQAGHDAAHAFLEAKNSAEASALFDALGSALAAAPREGLDGATRARLDGLGELATLGPGFVSLSEGKGDRAESFFRGLVDSVQTGAARNAARLGLGEALLLQSRLRPAQLALASASALSYSNVDIEARALLGLAQAYRALGDASEAKKTLERVVRVHGATTAAAKATELLKTL